MKDSQKACVVRLEMENFKSYGGQQTIGPFKNFTTIIGPNGSGKSNLMDAISFVLGVRTSHLRGNLKELLHTTGPASDADNNRPSRGHVTLVFQTDKGRTIKFQRTIVPSSGDAYASEYRIDGKRVAFEDYNNLLEKQGILVKARNCLVFQGDIENVAQMSPTDLTRMFEHVSGSEACRQHYEEAEAKMKELEEKQSFVFAKKKQITQEKRQKREQKEEAERHMGLQREMEEIQTRHYLWQIYHVEKDVKAARAELEHHKAALAQMEASGRTSDTGTEAARKIQAGMAKERLLLEKKIKRRQAESEKQNPGAIKTREQIAHLTRRIYAGERELATLRSKATEHGSRVAGLEEQLTMLQQAQQTLEQELAQGKARGKLKMSPELLKEYNDIKAEVGAKLAGVEADRSALASAQDADTDALVAITDSTSTISSRITELEKTAAEASERSATLSASSKQMDKELKEKTVEREKLLTERRRVETHRERLIRKIEESEDTLRQARADRKENEREAKMTEAITAMKREIGGVHGRVHELARVSHDKYKLALAVAMGRDFDAVIVDTEATAIKCIRFLKERRLPPVCFLPVATLQVKEIDPRLESLGGSARLAFSCLDPVDPNLSRVYQSICGNTLVCNSVDEARQLAFGGESRHKVVALDGTLFNKAGIITGGVTQGLEAKADKWTQKQQMELDKLLKNHSQLVQELQQLPALRKLTEKLQALEAAINRLQNASQYNAVDLKAAQQKAKELGDQAANLKKQRDAKAPDASRLERQIADRQKKLDQLISRINEVTDKMFSSFSKKVGVASIRDYEERHLKEAERAAEQKAALATQIARVKNQIDYNRREDPQTKVTSKEAEVAAQKEQLKQLQTEASQHDKAARQASAELRALSEESSKLKEKIEEAEGKVRELKKVAAARAGEEAKLRRGMQAAQAAIASLKGQRADLVKTAGMDQVRLPTTTASNGGDRDGGGHRKAKRSRQADDDGGEGDGEDMDIDGNGDNAGGGPPGPFNTATTTTTTTTTKPGSTTSATQFDFSTLSPQEKATLPSSRPTMDAEFRASLDDIRGQLARLAPNLKAVEQYEAVRQREAQQLEELDSAKREFRVAAETFHSLRQRRIDLFTTAFQHVAQRIDAIYKELTRSLSQPGGGQAYLSLESSEEPYLHGIKFTAMPPTKRFRDMEQLSGGEKTVAALALLFAVHSFQPAPFFVLDEVDAALDATNVVRVANYLRSMTREGKEGGFQGIVISLKDSFYEKSDALVGVTKDVDRRSSKAFTFDLNKFDPATP